jgi:hypothetical protein
MCCFSLAPMQLETRSNLCHLLCTVLRLLAERLYNGIQFLPYTAPNLMTRYHKTIQSNPWEEGNNPCKL